LRLESDIVKVGLIQVPLANRAIVVRAKPETYALFAKLVTTHREDTDREGGLTDDTHPLLIRLGFSIFEVDQVSMLRLCRR